MPYVAMQSLLEQALKNNAAVGSFNVFNLDTVQAVIAGAEKAKSPVIIALAESHLKYGDLEVLAYTIQNLAERAAIPVAAQFDHGKTIKMVQRALDLGFSSVMYDGYDISYEQKIAETREIVLMAHEKGVSVEAPLGRIGKAGEEEQKRFEHDKLTKAELVADFVNRTGIDNLAVAIGTAHGTKEGGTTLDFELLSGIKEQTNAYISLHGGSGVKDEDYRLAIKGGVSKISIFTRLSDAGRNEIVNQLKNSSPRLPDLYVYAKQAFADEVEYLINIFESHKLLD